jgi:uracil-DNA glycosylase family 4
LASSAWHPACGAPTAPGRPFTGDHAGLLLYDTLLGFGLAEGVYEERPGDGLRLKGTIILNSVKCLPPQNKPTPQEIATCKPFYQAALAAVPTVRVLVALGQIAHGSAVRTAGGRLSAYPFGHLAEHRLPDGRILIDSYHCSRYNQNTAASRARCSAGCSPARLSCAREAAHSPDRLFGGRLRLDPG